MGFEMLLDGFLAGCFFRYFISGGGLLRKGAQDGD